jgi:hypothetical protein
MLAMLPGWVPAAVQAQSGSNLWNEPVNLSTSGSTSSIVAAGEPNGQAHVMWWDKFDGAKYVRLNTEGAWSQPVTVAGIYGQRTRGQSGVTTITPPAELKLAANGKNQVFAFWRIISGDLMVARADSRNPKWSGGARLVTNPLVWSVYIGPDDSLNLVYVRAAGVGASEPGIYFRRSKDGTTWTEPVPVITSLYFRTLLVGNANLSVVADGNGQVFVGWDDPQTFQSYLAYSSTNGTKFGEPEVIQSGAIAEIAVPKHVRFVNLLNGKILRFWEAGDSCILYQQFLNDDLTWTDPVRALEKVNGCSRFTKAYAVSDGRVFMTVGDTPTVQRIITAWDGNTWADPQTPRAAFVDPDSDNLLTLDCQNLVLADQTVVLIGCDQHGDVWGLTSSVPATEFMPVVASSWGQPRIFNTKTTDVGLPGVGVDQQNRFHVVWSQSNTLGTTGDSLVYIRGDGTNWTDPAVIIRNPNGTISLPGLLADPNEVLHLVWSAGPTGQILYNQAFARDALIAADWGNSQSLPTLQPAGDSPDIELGRSGKLYAVYTIPFNENRGLYFTSSSDLGTTWSPVTLVFDATAANWGVIHQAQLAIDQQQHLHVVWSRSASPNQDSPQGIYYSHSLDDGATWSEPIEISAEVDSDPRLVVSSDNNLHLVWAHTILNGHELIHQWSPDGGQSWSVKTRIPDVGVVEPQTGLVADSAGSVYLVGMELTRESSAGIFYLRWDGTTWTDRDNLRLGYDFRAGTSVTAAVTPAGLLGIFFRVWAPNANGDSRFVVGYVGRQLTSNSTFVPAPTFTPRPLPTGLPAATAEPTLTPIPLGDLNGNGGGTSTTVWIQIAVVVIGMVIVSVIAIVQLSGRLGR